MHQPDVWLGVLYVELLIRGARSLKDRRRVLVRLKDRSRSRFGRAPVEVGEKERHNRAAVVFTFAGGQRHEVQKQLDELRSWLDLLPEAEVGMAEHEVFKWEAPGPESWLADLPGYDEPEEDV